MYKKPLPVVERSLELLKRAEMRIPAQTQTLAKGPGQHVRGVSPAFAARAKGAHLWDVDGNRYLDYTMAVGPVLLGYGHPVVNKAIERQLEDGITFSLMHPLEVEVAELLQEIVPNAEMVRYSKTGADVTSAAVRLARAHTGRSVVLCCGYHGWHDWYIATTDRAQGIPSAMQDLTYTIEFNNIQSVIDSIGNDVAAVILEPMVFEEPEGEFLSELRQVCDAHGVVLIFDEMWTGFRLANGGAQERFAVQADLVCYSKAIANGMPLSVLAGKSEIMKHLERDVFFFTTFGGEALSLAAAKATMSFVREHNVTHQIEIVGNALSHGLALLLTQCGIGYCNVRGLGARTMMAFDGSVADPLLMKSYVHQELLRHGILWNGFHTVSYAHTMDDVAVTLAAYSDVLPRLDMAIRAGNLPDQLLGSRMEPVFRRSGNFNTKPKMAVVERV